MDGVVRAIALGAGGQVALGFEPAAETFELGEPDGEIHGGLGEVDFEGPEGKRGAGGKAEQPTGPGGHFASKGQIGASAELDLPGLQLRSAELNQGKGVAELVEGKRGGIVEGAQQANDGEAGGKAAAVKTGGPEERGEARVEDDEIGGGNVVEFFAVESGQQVAIVGAAAGGVLIEGGEHGLKQLGGSNGGLVASRDGLGDVLGECRVQPGGRTNEEDLEEAVTIDHEMSIDFRGGLDRAGREARGGLLPGGRRQGGPRRLGEGLAQGVEELGGGKLGGEISQLGDSEQNLRRGGKVPGVEAHPEIEIIRVKRRTDRERLNGGEAIRQRNAGRGAQRGAVRELGADTRTAGKRQQNQRSSEPETARWSRTQIPS